MRKLGEAKLRLTEHRYLHHTLVSIHKLSWYQPSRGVKPDFRSLPPREFPLPPSAVYTSMTGGGGHETSCLDLISSALEGSGSGCSVLSDSPTPVQDSLDLCPATISTLHIEHGECVLHRILTPREILSAEH